MRWCLCLTQRSGMPVLFWVWWMSLQGFFLCKLLLIAEPFSLSFSFSFFCSVCAVHCWRLPIPPPSSVGCREGTLKQKANQKLLFFGLCCDKTVPMPVWKNSGIHFTTSMSYSACVCVCVCVCAIQIVEHNLLFEKRMLVSKKSVLKSDALSVCLSGGELWFMCCYFSLEKKTNPTDVKVNVKVFMLCLTPNST